MLLWERQSLTLHFYQLRGTRNFYQTILRIIVISPKFVDDTSLINYALLGKPFITNETIAKQYNSLTGSTNVRNFTMSKILFLFVAIAEQNEMTCIMLYCHLSMFQVSWKYIKKFKGYRMIQKKTTFSVVFLVYFLP